MKELLAEQRAAADPTVSVWVGASAGTGKTQVLTARVLRLLLARARPDRLLCITFTKAGAAEMRARVQGRLAAWVRCTDAELDGDLRAIGAEADTATRGRARALFATALDARGGVRVQTIHAFSASLLASFPLEAGLPPGFSALDERTGAELRERALADVLRSAEDDGDAVWLADVHAIAAESGADAVAGVAQTVARHWRGVAALGKPEAALRRMLRLPDGERDAALASAMADDAFPVATLADVIAGFRGASSDTRRARAEPLAAFQVAVNRLLLFDDARDAMLTKAGTMRADHLRACPKLTNELTTLADGFAAVDALARGLDHVAYAAARLRVGRRIAGRLRALKAAAGVIDFDDMIDEAGRLLGGDGAPSWVAYKVDSRIDHLLVDEAQDTNAAQWTVLSALTGDFFAGESARSGRTLFVVGDFKQSIFRFQGTDPRVFADTRERYRGDVPPPGLREVPLARSFRSVPAVLAVVDATIATIHARDPGGHSPFDREAVAPHTANRDGAAGRVTLWPLVAPPALTGAEAADDDEPIDAATMADRLADQIKAWLDPRDPLTLPAHGRPVQAGEIMVLVRTRSDLVGPLIAGLHRRGVPVAGADRTRLLQPLAVRDCLALARFALLPDDDMALAQALVSPLVGLDQDALMRIALGRRDTLWRAVRDAADAGDGAAVRAADWLRRVLAIADFMPPFEFFETVLGGELGGRAAMFARLGEEARDGLELLLHEALAFERAHAPTLQRFLNWIERGEVEVKREAADAAAGVRIMTVHGAKGLQSPVVILADAGGGAKTRTTTFVPWRPDDGEALPMFHGPQGTRPAAVEAVLEHEAALDAAERWRLLYVAMTRAEDLLFIGGGAPALKGKTEKALAAAAERARLSWHGRSPKPCRGLGRPRSRTRGGRARRSSTRPERRWRRSRSWFGPRRAG